MTAARFGGKGRPRYDMYKVILMTTLAKSKSDGAIEHEQVQSTTLRYCRSKRRLTPISLKLLDRVSF